MEGTAGLGHLATEDWERLQEILDRFEKAWNNVGSEDAIDLKAYLPPVEDPLRPVALSELIKAELEIRWQRGQAIHIESYLNDFPELQVVGTLPPLIYEEYRVRHMHGDKPPVTTYKDRFPKDYEEVKRLVQEQPMPTLMQTNTPSPTPAKEEKNSDQPSQGTQVGSASLAREGEYKKIKRLGSGGFGEVWLGEAPGGVPCAIKVVFRPIEHEAAQREIQSLELIKTLRHPFLLATQRFNLVDGKLQIVMELADGSLRDRLKECAKAGLHGIPVAELIRYFREAAEAIDYLHSERVIHRDIKPDNILILNKHAKVADFGLARFHESEHAVSASGSGTPAYMAPEVWRRKVSERSDQYSLAMSYVELRLDRSFTHDMMEIMLEHLERTPDLNPLPEAEQNVLKKALSKDPTHRYPSCLAFIEALERAVGPDLGGTPTHPQHGLDRDDQTARGQGGYGASQSGGDTYDTMAQRGGTAGRAASDPYGSVTRVGESSPKPGWRAKGSGAVKGLPGGAVKTASSRNPLKIVLLVVLLPIVALITFVSVRQLNGERDNDSKEVKSTKDKVVKDGGSGTERPSDIFLPPNCKNDGDDFDIRGRKYYKRINYLFPDGTKIPFVLISKDSGTDPPTFYMMVNKVSINLFRKFAKAETVKNNKWEQWSQDKNPDVPVMEVNAVDAYNFARWIGGDLPGEDEWDKAAGLFQPNIDKEKGPFNTKEPIKEGDRNQFGLSRTLKEGPMICGTATMDISEPFGVRDMAANGREWMRNVPDFRTRRIGGNPPLTDRDELMLRGRSYLRDLKEDGPLTYKELANPYKREIVNHLETRPDVGFRVVLDNFTQ